MPALQAMFQKVNFPYFVIKCSTSRQSSEVYLRMFTLLVPRERMFHIDKLFDLDGYRLLKQFIIKIAVIIRTQKLIIKQTGTL